MAVERVDTWNATSAAQPVISWLSRLIRRLQTSNTQPSRLEKIARSAALFPVFSVLVLILRLRVLLRRPPLDVVVRTPDGFAFRCTPPDLIQMYLWLFGVWEPELTGFIGAGLKPGDGFLDVGANIGYFSVLAARCVGQGGSVVAVEPSQKVVALLEETRARNGLSAVIRCVNAAAARDVGSVAIYAGPAHNIGLTTTVEERGFEMEGVVQSLPLDAMLSADETHVLRMIKIDVEGREPDVLLGMQDLIRNSRPDLEVLIELSPDWWSDPRLGVTDVLQPFLDAGFNIYEIENSYWPWRYLWPRSIPRPKRRRSRLPHRAHRLDLILSRRDAEFL